MSYKMNVIPNKECILIIHKFELIALVNITLYLANSAEDESDLIRNIQFNLNLRIININYSELHSFYIF